MSPVRNARFPLWSALLVVLAGLPTSGCGNVLIEERREEEVTLRAASSRGVMEETPKASFLLIWFSQSGIDGAANRLSGSDSAFEGLALLTLARSSEGTLAVPDEAQAVVRIQHPAGGSTWLARSGSIAVRQQGSSRFLDLRLSLWSEREASAAGPSTSLTALDVEVVANSIDQGTAIPRGYLGASEAMRGWLAALTEARANRRDG